MLSAVAYSSIDTTTTNALYLSLQCPHIHSMPSVLPTLLFIHRAQRDLLSLTFLSDQDGLNTTG